MNFSSLIFVVVVVVSKVARLDFLEGMYLLKCPSPNFFIFLTETIPYWNNFCEKILRFEQNAIFFTNFWSLHFCGTPAQLIRQTSRLTYHVMWRKLRNSHCLAFISCTQKRSITSKDWITVSSQEESFSETEKPTRTLNVFLSIKSRVP